jgi:Fe-S-cluster containining protein
MGHDESIPMFRETACSCNTCKNMCTRACWPTPEEAQRLIDAGYSDRLMVDYWVVPTQYDDEGDPIYGTGDIYILCPAENGSEGRMAPSWPGVNWCTFSDPNTRLCMLHDTGLKPFEGRMAHHSKPTPNLHEKVAMMWNNPDAQALVERWRESQNV